MSDIAILMLKDPFEMTRFDIDEIIKDLRSRRHLFNSGIKVGAAPAKAATKAKKLGIEPGDFSL
jgi:hypothetical protein